jgi:hypothetical protein
MSGCDWNGSLTSARLCVCACARMKVCSQAQQRQVRDDMKEEIH